MKIILLITTLNILISPAFANSAVQLSCSQRHDVTISRFSYELSTMKWDDNFVVASGIKKDQTESGIPFRITYFTNGDALFFFPENQKYFFQYSGETGSDKCRIMKTFTYPIAKLPYEKPNS